MLRNCNIQITIYYSIYYNIYKKGQSREIAFLFIVHVFVCLNVTKTWTISFRHVEAIGLRFTRFFVQYINTIFAASPAAQYIYSLYE